ncbi:hypothetical protein WR25_22943 [Diploscapter pachys]|uniref:Carbohydrate sulfotransferase n=1 Tax=Diploscapter pachys TaxID=2018661 RepID=A0A2A2LC53_9BILA|nr:hypothetical protein WR25_22943 [Diploscapter pachys]
MCKRNSTDCVAKYVRFETRYRISSEYKMAHCVVQKSMSSLMSAIMCYLYDSGKYRKHYDDFAQMKAAKLCRPDNEFNDSGAIRKLYNLTEKNFRGWSFSMITRDPVERFVSGFVDRCIRKPTGKRPCSGCGKNLTCFVVSEYKRMIDQSRSGYIPLTFEDVHFFPQTWRCNLYKEYPHMRFIRYSSDPSKTLSKELIAELRRQDVPNNKIDFITSRLVSGRKTEHTTVHSPVRKFIEQRLRSSQFLMEFIVKMFFYDFELLEYEFPEGFR